MRWSVLLSFAAHFLKGGHEVIRGLRGKTPEVGHEVALVGLLQPNPPLRASAEIQAKQILDRAPVGPRGNGRPCAVA
jgi:hypothetical protein